MKKLDAYGDDIFSFGVAALISFVIACVIALIFAIILYATLNNIFSPKVIVLSAAVLSSLVWITIGICNGMIYQRNEKGYAGTATGWLLGSITPWLLILCL